MQAAESMAVGEQVSLKYYPLLHQSSFSLDVCMRFYKLVLVAIIWSCVMKIWYCVSPTQQVGYERWPSLNVSVLPWQVGWTPEVIWDHMSVTKLPKYTKIINKTDIKWAQNHLITDFLNNLSIHLKRGVPTDSWYHTSLESLIPISVRVCYGKSSALSKH